MCPALNSPCWHQQSMWHTQCSWKGKLHWILRPACCLLGPDYKNHLSHVLRSFLLHGYFERTVYSPPIKSETEAFGTRGCPQTKFTLYSIHLAEKNIFLCLVFPRDLSASVHVCAPLTFRRVLFAGQKAKCCTFFPALGCSKPWWRQQARAFLCVRTDSVTLGTRVCLYLEFLKIKNKNNQDCTGWRLLVPLHKLSPD